MILTLCSLFVPLLFQELDLCNFFVLAVPRPLVNLTPFEIKFLSDLVYFLVIPIGVTLEFSL